MNNIKYYESNIELTLIEKLINIGFEYGNINDSWSENRRIDSFIDTETLKERLRIINPNIKEDILETVIKKICRIENPSLFERNHIFHNYLIDGITIEDHQARINPLIKLIDFKNVKNNTFQVYNQLKFKEYNETRIPDVILYINGIPLVIFELKSLEQRENTDLYHAYEQLGGNSENNGYRYDIPTLYNYNSLLVVGNGATTKVGTITSDWTHYNEWKSKNGEIGYKKEFAYKLDVIIEGLFIPNILLDIIQNNLFFKKKKSNKNEKILAQYYQYYCVKKTHLNITKHLKPNSDGRAGIVWHTQGSGKSFSMVMLTHRLIKDITLQNPTIIVLTDRNDLDNQLFETFSSVKEFLRTQPIQIDSRNDLVDRLSKLKEGGIIFTTIQKFDKNDVKPNFRTNIIVLSDEAHRSHYGIDEKLIVKKKEDGSLTTLSQYGYAKYIRDVLPNATFVGFTGTPVDNKEHSTVAIFGEIIDTYDMTQSIEDESTVRIFYESRLTKVFLDENKIKEVDEYYKYLLTDGAETNLIETSKRKMSKMEVIIGDENRLKLLATDIISHYNERKTILNGKAMIICYSRKIALSLYELMIQINPLIKEITEIIVTEGNKDTDYERTMFKNKDYRNKKAIEFKDSNSKFKIAIVVDMWLTGFDVVDLDVMYIDKPMKDHNLMQAIARVNRVYKGKQSGLIVDYISLHHALNKALSTYTARDRECNLLNVQNIAKTMIQELLSILNELFYKIDITNFFSTIENERFKTIQDGADFILENEDRKKRFLDTTKQLKDSYIVALGILDTKTKKLISYFITVRHFIQRILYDNDNGKFDLSAINKKVTELIAEAIKGDEVKILTQLQEDNKNSVWELLSEKKVEELRKSNPPHIFIKIMERLLKEAIIEYRAYNLIKAQEYSEKLKELLLIYNSRENDLNLNITILGLVSFSHEMVESEEYAKNNNLIGRERAFYDALTKDKKAVELMNDETLKLIAKELKTVVEEYATIDWSKKRDTQAKMRMKIRLLLKKYNYPPDYSEIATDRVIKQAEYTM